MTYDMEKKQRICPFCGNPYLPGDFCNCHLLDPQDREQWVNVENLKTDVR